MDDYIVYSKEYNQGYSKAVLDIDRMLTMFDKSKFLTDDTKFRAAATSFVDLLMGDEDLQELLRTSGGLWAFKDCGLVFDTDTGKIKKKEVQ